MISLVGVGTLIEILLLSLLDISSVSLWQMVIVVPSEV